MEKIESIGLVLYNPISINNLSLDLIAEKKSLFLFIYLNSEVNDLVTTQLNQLIKLSPNVIILGDKINIGLSKSYNKISFYANRYNVKNILLIDQDTIINVERLVQFVIPKVNYQKIICYHIKHGIALENININLNTGFFINNGSIFQLSELNKIGGFNEKYFVELVDYELQYRSNRNGYSFVEIAGTGIFNHIENQGLIDIKIKKKIFRIKLYNKRRIFEYLKSSVRLLLTALRDIQLVFFYKFFKQFVQQISIIITHKILWKILK